MHQSSCRQWLLTAAAFLAAWPSLSGAAKGVTETEVVVGQPAAFTGPSAELGLGMWLGAAAAFDEVNRKGGVHGRQVRLVAQDDAYDPDRTLDAVQKLWHLPVFALFGGVGTPTILKLLPAMLELNRSEGMFYFANFSGADAQREQPYVAAVFNVRASYRAETRAIVDALHAAGYDKVGVFIQDDAYGASGLKGVQVALDGYHLKPVAEARYLRGQEYGTSNAGAVKVLRGAGANAVVAVGAYQACAGFVRDARDSGWNAPIFNLSFVGADAVLALLSSEGKPGHSYTQQLYNSQVVPSYLDTSLPLVKAYREALGRFKGTPPAPLPPHHAQHSFVSMEGYASARAFLYVLEHTPEPLTRAAFMQTAEGLGKVDIGLGVPLEFSRRHQGLSQVWFTAVRNGQWMDVPDMSETLKRSRAGGPMARGREP